MGPSSHGAGFGGSSHFGGGGGGSGFGGRHVGGGFGEDNNDVAWSCAGFSEDDYLSAINTLFELPEFQQLGHAMASMGLNIRNNFPLGMIAFARENPDQYDHLIPHFIEILHDFADRGMLPPMTMQAFGGSGGGGGGRSMRGRASRRGSMEPSMGGGGSYGFGGRGNTRGMGTGGPLHHTFSSGSGMGGPGSRHNLGGGTSIGGPGGGFGGPSMGGRGPRFGGRFDDDDDCFDEF